MYIICGSSRAGIRMLLWKARLRWYVALLTATSNARLKAEGNQKRYGTVFNKRNSGSGHPVP